MGKSSIYCMPKLPDREGKRFDLHRMLAVAAVHDINCRSGKIVGS